MDADRRELALMVLSLLHDGDQSSGPSVDSDRALEGQAYLNGFVIQVLADALRVPAPAAVDHLRRLLGEGPEGAGVREPRRPRAPLPSLAAERDPSPHDT